MACLKYFTITSRISQWHRSNSHPIKRFLFIAPWYHGYRPTFKSRAVLTSLSDQGFWFTAWFWSVVKFNVTMRWNGFDHTSHVFGLTLLSLKNGFGLQHPTRANMTTQCSRGHHIARAWYWCAAEFNVTMRWNGLVCDLRDPGLTSLTALASNMTSLSLTSYFVEKQFQDRNVQSEVSAAVWIYGNGCCLQHPSYRVGKANWRITAALFQAYLRLWHISYQSGNF